MNGSVRMQEEAIKHQLAKTLLAAGAGFLATKLVPVIYDAVLNMAQERRNGQTTQETVTE